MTAARYVVDYYPSRGRGRRWQVYDAITRDSHGDPVVIAEGMTEAWARRIAALLNASVAADPHCHNGLQCLAPVSCICLCCKTRSKAP